MQLSFCLVQTALNAVLVTILLTFNLCISLFLLSVLVLSLETASSASPDLWIRFNFSVNARRTRRFFFLFYLYRTLALGCHLQLFPFASKMSKRMLQRNILMCSVKHQSHQGEITKGIRRQTQVRRMNNCHFSPKRSAYVSLQVRRKKLRWI